MSKRSKRCKAKGDRQNLVVRLSNGGGIVLTGSGAFGVASTVVEHNGILYAYDGRGYLVAQFAKGSWLYTLHADQQVQS